MLKYIILQIIKRVIYKFWSNKMSAKNLGFFMVGIILTVLLIVLSIAFINKDKFFTSDKNYRLFNESRTLNDNQNLNDNIGTSEVEKIENDKNIDIKSDKNVRLSENVSNKKTEKKEVKDIPQKQNITEKKVVTKKSEDMQKISNTKKSNPEVKKVIYREEGKAYVFKQADFSSQNFDSLGEYISKDEYQYRTELVKNLTIKTIVVNSLTKGNGISQEFFKIAFENKMIPAKILEVLIESKEFRDLIPEESLKYERKISDKEFDRPVRFENSEIRELLLLWCKGQLTPIQKAWVVGSKEL